MVASPTFVIGEERQVVQLVQGEVRELHQNIGETWLLCAPPPSSLLSFSVLGMETCWAGALPLDYTPAPA